MAGGRPLHVPRLPRVRARRGRRRGRAAPGRGLGARAPARRRAHAARRSPSCPPRVRALAREPQLLVLTKANARSTVHRPSYLDYVGVKRFDEDGEVVGERRFLGLYTTAAYRAAPRDIPVLRRKVAAVIERAAFPRGQPRREGADRDPRDLPARRAVPDRRGRAVRDRDGDPRPRRAPARAAVRAPRPLRALRLLPRLPPARPLQHAEPRAHPGDPARGVRGRERRLRAAAVRVGARAHPLHRPHRRPGELPAYDAARSRRGSSRRRARGATSSQDALVEELGEEAGTALLPPLRPTRSRPPTATTGSPARRSPTSAGIEALGATTTLGVQPLPPARGARRHVCAASSTGAASASRSPTCCRCSRAWASRSLDERPYRVAPARRARRPGSTTSACTTPRTPTSTPTRSASASRTASRASGAATSRTTASTRLVLARRADWREVTVLRAVARYLRQAGTTFSDSYMERTLLAHADVAALARRAVPRALRPGAGAPRRGGGRGRAAEIEERDRRGREPRRGPHPARLPARSSARCCAPTSSSPAHDGGRSPTLAFKLDPSRCPARPAAAPALRDLRALAARRGRAPARRQRRARRPALVGPARGLPHRDPRPDEGADGQERADRAGRREGRRSSSSARRDDARGAASTRSSPATARSSAGCSTSPTTSSTARSCRRRDVVRYDGDDPYLVVAADKGTATFSDIANAIAHESRLLARRRVRVRRLGRLRPQGDGHHRARRVGVGRSATSASWASTSQTDATSRSSASATCPATCSATACCSRSTSGWSARSTTATSSSTPTPTPAASLRASAGGCSSCPRSSWDDYDRAADLARAAACGRGRRSRSRCRRRCARALGVDGRASSRRTS